MTLGGHALKPTVGDRDVHFNTNACMSVLALPGTGHAHAPAACGTRAASLHAVSGHVSGPYGSKLTTGHAVHRQQGPVAGAEKLLD